MIQSPSNSTSETKRQRHASQRHAQRDPPIAREETHVDFQADEEQKQDQTEIGDEVEIRHGVEREYRGAEMGNAAKDRGPEEDAADYFRDDSGLVDQGKG
jgi:hypothetical protein